MHDKLIINNPDKLGEVIEDLQKTLSDDGGMIQLPELFKMTILEFLATVASSNGIRFYYNKKFVIVKHPGEDQKPMKPPRPRGPIPEISNVSIFDEEEVDR
jgi:hypothetical protein